MRTLEDRFMIKEMYRKGVSSSEIARRTGRDRKTIRHLVTAPVVPSPKPRKMRPRKASSSPMHKGSSAIR